MIRLKRRFLLHRPRAGAISATFNVGTTPVTAVASGKITASLNGVTKQAGISVVPAVIQTVAVKPSHVYGGLVATGTVVLSGPAPTGGVTVQIGTTDAAATVPISTFIAAGSTTSPNFPVNTTPVSKMTPGLVTASYNHLAVSTQISVLPPAVSSLSAGSASVKGGAQTTLKIILTSPAPSSGAVVTFMSSDPAVAVTQGSVLVASGQTTVGVILLTSSPIAANTPVTITAHSGGLSASAVVTVTP